MKNIFKSHLIYSGINFAIGEFLIPFFSRMPDKLGKYLTDDRYETIKFILSKTNPVYSFCLVKKRNVDIGNNEIYYFLPLRYFKDHYGLLSARPSSSSNVISTNKDWISDNGFEILKNKFFITDIKFIELSHSNSKRKYIATNNLNDAQVGISYLCNNFSLWNDMKIILLKK